MLPVIRPECPSADCLTRLCVCTSLGTIIIHGLSLDNSNWYAANNAVRACVRAYVGVCVCVCTIDQLQKALGTAHPAPAVAASLPAPAMPWVLLFMNVTIAGG
ncbi:hypothetical protein ABBQ38_004041 [Trebouxia sp. C0009 RCD-2024]